MDELSSYLMNAYKENSATVVLSSGDMWQGSAESNLTRGAIITEWMNEMDFVSMTLGNHEFDWGSEYIDANRELAEFPILAINIFDKSTGERADYCEASVIVERNGVKIGIIGAIGDCKSSISSSYVTDVDFKVGRMNCHQIFGWWNGDVTLDDGTKIEIKDLFTFCEYVENRW